MPINTASLPPVLPLRVMMRAGEAQFVPAFAGSALHGALGRSLWKTVCAFPQSGVEIRLLTPLRLKREGKFQGRPSPVDFALTLARRANALGALYSGGEHPIDEREVEGLAREIESEPPETRLVHVRRYSARQGDRMEWPGVIGRLRWRGAALAELWPLLKFGEMVQIGKGATLGFGRYAMLRSGNERV